MAEYAWRIDVMIPDEYNVFIDTASIKRRPV